MRPADGARSDPLLKIGAVAMFVALLCAGLLTVYVLLSGEPEAAGADAAEAASAEPLVRSDPGVEPWKEEDVPPPEMPAEPERAPSEPEPVETDPGPAQPEKDQLMEPEESLPLRATAWPVPTAEQVAATAEPRRYDPPRGAVLSLTVPALDLYDVPVLRSDTRRALNRGVVHARGTSLPWSRTPERNVYLAGHRFGWPGTGSHLVFYRLDELAGGDEVVLTSRDKGKYRYRVTESFVVGPEDTWVMGRVVGEDMVTLQTCTPIPGFQRRLIVRAERA